MAIPSDSQLPGRLEGIPAFEALRVGDVTFWTGVTGTGWGLWKEKRRAG